MNESAERALRRVEPIHIGDQTLEYIVEALNLHNVEIDQVVPDTDTHITWARILDPYTCPTWALGWLAQHVGVRLLPSDTEQQARDRISAAAGLRRTTDQAMKDEVALTLTGTKTVQVLNRVGNDSWAQTVKVKTSECPDPTASLAAALRQKRAGVILTFVVSNDVAWAEATRTWAAVANGVTWTNVQLADVT